jgi:hypothetical protein
MNRADSGQRSKSLVFAALWIASTVLAYVLGSSRNPASKPPGDNTPGRIAQQEFETPEPPVRAEAEAELRDLPADFSNSLPAAFPVLDVAQADVAEGVPHRLNGEEIKAYLGPALTSTDLVGRNLVIAHMLSRLTRENAGDMLRVFESTPRSFHTDHNYELFLHAWARIDGEAAIDYIRNSPNAYRAGYGDVWAMSGWAQSDPEAAFDYVRAQDHVDHGLYHGLVRGWARVDLAEAYAYVVSIEDEGLRRRLVGALGESYMEQHGVAGSLIWATEAAEVIEDAGFARAALADVIRRGAAQDAVAVAEWISQNLDHPNLQPWMFGHTAGQLADRDPQFAAAWVQAHAESEQINAGVVGRVVGEWAERDPAAAAQWVDGFRETGLLDKGTANRLASSWASQDSGAAFDWVDTLKPEFRRGAYGGIIGRMPESELESAGDWIRSAPIGRVMDGARTAYAWRILDDDPAQALAQIRQVADPNSIEQFLVPLAQEILKSDPGTLVAWLPTSGLSVSAQQRVLRGNQRDQGR